ncbi:hypothetical protein LSH36_1034g00003 [Paralvinella palmiformis]|uniref:G-protein coupled receptors family 1 profile domain-containing protein n=1 Tax=Paralvinella palmiformis TaxID=53620 RepID=A0AAD9MS50_9ANNE|nr:hypothetical protein LSH36_1034g00003 [Paralvinella palmiformis]
MEDSQALNATNRPHFTQYPPTSYAVYEVGYVFVPLLLVVGVVGNSLTITVMTSASFRTLPVSKMLIAMSLSDTVVNLLFPFNKPFMSQLIGTDIRALSSGGCKLFFWTYRFAKTGSSWMVVMISFERFVAVWFPMKSKFITTERNVYIAMAVLYGVFAVFFGYWCSWADRVIDGSCVINSRPAGFEIQSEVFLVFGLVLYSFGPSFFLVIVNILIVYKLIRIRKSISPISNTQSFSRCTKTAVSSRTTIMLLSVAISFVVLVTPNAVAHIVSFVRRKPIFETTDPVIVYLRAFVQLLEQLNHSINFALYVLCSKRFRDGLLIILRFKKTQNSSGTTHGIHTATNS